MFYRNHVDSYAVEIDYFRPLKGEYIMIVNVPTKIIPVWFIERWAKENAEPDSPLDMFIKQMLKDWELEEIRQSKLS